MTVPAAPQLDLRSVSELRIDRASGAPYRYHVAAYQRGYRWEATQVRQLLDDIREFHFGRNGDFYCLQPLVLRRCADGAFEVIDGQQRLTTLLLVLRHLNRRQSEPYRQPTFVLTYETRPDLADFLDHLDDTARAEKDINFFHIANAAQAIEEWFASYQDDVGELTSTLLKRAKLIWYELPATEKAVAAFTRLNVGKIPLTDGELIRALFLKDAGAHGGDPALALGIAYDWDRMEKSLQRPAFWGFLSNDLAWEAGRIGLLFELLAPPAAANAPSGDFTIFRNFSERLAANGVEREWREIRRVFFQLEEWFEHRRLFHLIGFLIATGTELRDLFAYSADRNKREFRDELRARCVAAALGNGAPATDGLHPWITDRVDCLRYSDRNTIPLRRVLLLFNVAALLLKKESNVRFQFDSYKEGSGQWDIEHIRSQKSDAPAGYPGQVEWLGCCRSFFRQMNETSELTQRIDSFLARPANEIGEGEFAQLFDDVLQRFGEDGDAEPDHSLGNLALLDAGTNRGYGNAVFEIKRRRILDHDRDGVFVPLCTRNVFLKCYSPQVEQTIRWTPADRDGYRQAVIDTLAEFAMGGWLHE